MCLSSPAVKKNPPRGIVEHTLGILYRRLVHRCSSDEHRQTKTTNFWFVCTVCLRMATLIQPSFQQKKISFFKISTIRSLQFPFSEPRKSPHRGKQRVDLPPFLVTLITPFFDVGSQRETASPHPHVNLFLLLITLKPPHAIKRT